MPPAVLIDLGFEAGQRPRRGQVIRWVALRA